jgi:PA14 domain
MPANLDSCRQGCADGQPAGDGSAPEVLTETGSEPDAQTTGPETRPIAGGGPGVDGTSPDHFANDPDPVDGPLPSASDGSTANLRAKGAACAAGNECVSGICAQGVCCDGECAGICRQCNAAGNLGTCIDVPDGQDPLEQCADEGLSSCGTEGACDGKGGCRFYRPDSVCAPAACGAGGFEGSKACVAAHLCQGPAPVSCGKFRCGSSGCATSCASSADCLAPNVCQAGACGGLKGDYYDNIDFTALRLTRVDPVVSFSWPDRVEPGVGSPDPTIGTETFSIRWTGQVTAPSSGEITFFVISDDRARLSVNGTQIVNDLADHPAREVSGKITLTQGQSYPIVLEFAENLENAAIRLSWSSASLAKEVIPARALTPAP